MRVGTYGVMDGTVYRARASYYSIKVFSDTRPPDQRPWSEMWDGRWVLDASRDDITRLYQVWTEATFDSLPVTVDQINRETGKIGIIAEPGAGGAGQQLAYPPHKDLSPMHGNAASLDGWYGNVDIDRLTDIRESVEELDLSRYGHPEPPPSPPTQTTPEAPTRNS